LTILLTDEKPELGDCMSPLGKPPPVVLIGRLVDVERFCHFRDLHYSSCRLTVAPTAANNGLRNRCYKLIRASSIQVHSRLELGRVAFGTTPE
jgi:hypothetical protein